MSAKGSSKLRDASDAIPSYQKVTTSYVEPESGKKVWKTVDQRFEPEGFSKDELDGLGYADLEEMSEEETCSRQRPTKLREDVFAPPQVGPLTVPQLREALEQGRSVTERAKALEELMRREVTDLSAYVVRELSRDELMPAWRNTLIFACEHLRFCDFGNRTRLRGRLFELVTKLNAEYHPRSKLAQEAALRRYISLIDDKRQLGKLVRFLASEFPTRLRLIALLGVQNAFASGPPSGSLHRELRPLQHELRQVVEFYFRAETLARSEEDFDFGLTAFETLTRLGDRTASEFARRARQMEPRWVVRQLSRSLNETRAAWTRPGSSASEEAVSAIGAALQLLEPDRSSVD